MRSLVLVPLALGLALLPLGCKSTDRAVNAAAKSIVTAVPRAGVGTEISLIRGQINLYKTMHGGKNPPTLKAMSTLPRLKYPNEYVYDANTGKVQSKHFPSL